MRISDWSSDVCSSDLLRTAIEHHHGRVARHQFQILSADARAAQLELPRQDRLQNNRPITLGGRDQREDGNDRKARARHHEHIALRSEEHTSELQSLMRISYAVFCLKKKKATTKKPC